MSAPEWTEETQKRLEQGSALWQQEKDTDAALAQIDRLTAEVKRLSAAKDDAERSQNDAIGRCVEAQALAERERARADDHDSARQSEKERADYAEAKLAGYEANIEADQRRLNLHIDRGDLAEKKLAVAEAELAAARELERVLREATRHLLNAIRFKTPTVEFSPENWFWEARIPVAFVDGVEAALHDESTPSVGDSPIATVGVETADSGPSSLRDEEPKP